MPSRRVGSAADLEDFRATVSASGFISIRIQISNLGAHEPTTLMFSGTRLNRGSSSLLALSPRRAVLCRFDGAILC